MWGYTEIAAIILCSQCTQEMQLTGGRGWGAEGEGQGWGTAGNSGVGEGECSCVVWSSFGSCGKKQVWLVWTLW